MQRKPDINCINCESRGKGVFRCSELSSLEYMSSNKTVNLYKRGQNLFLQGNPPFGLYCINSGKIKVTKLGRGGKETIVRIATSGELLGHRSLFSDSPYSASATVLEDARVCFVSKNDIAQVIQNDPKTAFEIINCLSQQMGAAESKVASLSQKNVRQRLAELLLIFRQSFGVKVDLGYKLDVVLTREEMASMVGTASENLIRLISDFKKEGLIEQERKHLIIVDVDRLEDVAGLEI